MSIISEVQPDIINNREFSPLNIVSRCMLCVVG